ncbi:ABC transporter ATP-binding protein [Stackebrandtia soli]|uniref:ABC transporter ATP-binding protein n=1 Tax=Stackebrandtia soli TaxID=1892856 RepID=UPI0039EA366E
MTADAVTVRLGGQLIVDEVSFHVDAGEWLTIIGPNGAGKSTLLAAVAGLIPADGDVRVGGRSLAELPRRVRARALALVAQRPTQPPGMAVLDYVLLGRTPHMRPLGRESRHDVDIAASVCDRLDIGGFLDRDLDTLSGGERQRVFLARALTQLSGTPDGLLMLDEPTSALDIGHQQEVLELVEQLRVDDGLTVVSTMHDLSIAGEYADRMLLLSRGRVAATGTPSEVLTEDALELHYGATVRVVESEWGPIVVPARRAGGTRGPTT